MPSTLTHIQCLECGTILKDTSILIDVCPDCGSGWLDAQYDYKAVQSRWKKPPIDAVASLWRYDDLLPVNATEAQIPMGEGWTPLYRLMQYEHKYGHKGKLYIKDERTQPTNSFKDRQAALSVMAMAQTGVTECVLASTGNAAVAYAAYCARAGIKLWLFLTSLVPPEKMREAAIYGCEVIKVSGTYDETKHVAAAFAARKGIRHDKGAKSIPGKESMKTIAYEIAEQLGLEADPAGSWVAPDWYIQAVSGGIGPIGVWKGFKELYAMGLIDKLPKLAIVQAAGCSPMVKAFHAGAATAEPVTPHTLIHVLATGDPGKAYEFLREACLETGGTMLAVEDGEAFAAMREAASLGGLSVEPATSVAFAGLTKMLQDGSITPNENVVLNCSGHTFPAESHILNSQYDRYVLEMSTGNDVAISDGGLSAAIESLTEQVTTIVVVDDDPLARRLVRRFLRRYKQYRVYEARDGEHALTVIRERNPDLIVMDLMMPRMSGFDLLEQLRANPATHDIPVIVATAKTLTIHDRQQLDQSVAAVWQKAGIEPREFVKQIVTTLGHESLGLLHQQEGEPTPLVTNPKIVIVDDNPLDLRLAKRIIQSGGTEYDIVEAENGREGLKAIYDTQPDLIILDMTLPDMDGIEIVETLQRNNSLRDIPILIYSARELTIEEQQTFTASIRNIIHKSDVNRQQFLTMVEDELGD